MAWWKIIANGATIAEIAKQIYNTINKDKSNVPPPSSDIQSLLMRIDYLEKNEIRQAELIKKMAEQMNALSNKINTVNIISIISAIVATISILFQLLNK